MAIGKVNAYATVQAPNVDFGDIALNAQKFQQADLERKKDLKLAQLKAEKVKPIEYTANGEVIPSGIKVYDLAISKLAQTAIQRKNELYNKATEKGGVNFLTPEEQAEYYRVPDLIKTLTETNKQVGANAKLLLENVGKKSGVMQSKLDLLGHGFDNQEDAEPIYSNGSYVFKFPEIEVSNNPTTGEVDRKFVLDKNGQKVYKKFYNRDGTQADSISQSEMQNAKAYDIMDSYDPNEDAKKIQAAIVGNEVGTDNGYKKASNLYYEDERVKKAIDSSIDSLVGNRDKRINVLYNYYQAHKNDKNLSEEDKANLERYSHPMLEKEYTDKDNDIVRGEYENIIFGKFGKKHTEDVNLAEVRAQKEEDLKKYRLSLVPVTISKRVSPDVVRKGFVTIPDASPTTNSGYSVISDSGKSIQLPAGSTLTGVTKGKGGSALIRVAEPVSKTELYKVAKNNGWSGYNQSKSPEDNEAELASYTKGKETKEAYYTAPEVTVNSMLQGNSSVKDYSQVLNIVVDKKWRAPKKTTPTTNQVKSR